MSSIVAVALCATVLMAPGADAQAKAPRKRARPTPHRHHRPRPRPPSVITNRPLSVAGDAAAVAGRVNPNGHATTWWFQYGASSRYGWHTPGIRVGSGRRAKRIWGVMTRLHPLATYHYRLVASRCRGCRGGTTYGADATVTTLGYANPLYTQGEFADPFVLTGTGASDYWAFGTGERFPILHSGDLVHWESAGSALPAKPAWVVQSGDWHPWAPHVVIDHGPCPGTTSPQCFVMFYTGLSAQFNTNCVAVATSTVPNGPYVDLGPLSNGSLDAAGRPIGCGDDAGYGMIDPSVFVDPATGARYLYASEDFACPPGSASCTAADSALQPTISVIPLAGDYLTATGARTPLFSGAAGTWEAVNVAVPTVEGPSVMLHGGVYYLLYSGGNWRSNYGMGYATATNPTGPFTRSANPVLTQNASVFGPGGADTLVTGAHGDTWLVYHGRESTSKPRALRIDRFSWQPPAPGGGPAPDAPVIAGPTSVPQPSVP